MSRSDGTIRYGSVTPRTPTTPTFEQLLRASCDGSRWSGTNSPTYFREHDMEDQGHDYQRKSVLAKVKEKARRWRQNLGKKKGVDQDNGTPSWAVSLKEEEDDGDDDAEYLGAPMYESELAPEICRENARQHPRANPVISEKHILPNSPRQGNPLPMSNSPSSNVHVNISVTSNLPVNSSTSPNKTLAMSTSAPNHENTSKMQGLTIGAQPDATSGGRADVDVARQNPAIPKQNPESPKQNVTSLKQKTWDKGISVKEYLSHKLEPGEDDRALSKAITEAMSPRKARDNGNSPTSNIGIVEKVKDAFNAFLQGGESSSLSNAHPFTRHAPISNTTSEIVEEETHGRIPQAN
ncbi:hypothetical protein MLD38_009658 [Melastoma candidum]|uniref:Uncharacterized protein n=1 Tax=Melastoma candidum TaxID=119954 RepID=A0ACB9RXW4_9MYRT|nr:hypothetical protein MLD38_009658 [Melastoma candidum]